MKLIYVFFFFFCSSLLVYVVRERRVYTHLAGRTTAQRRTCRDCGKKRWGLQSRRSRAAFPSTLGRTDRTGAAVEEGAVVEAGWAAGGSRTGKKVQSGCSPSKERIIIKKKTWGRKVGRELEEQKCIKLALLAATSSWFWQICNLSKLGFKVSLSVTVSAYSSIWERNKQINTE